jgi:hypothetical protein
MAIYSFSYPWWAGSYGWTQLCEVGGNATLSHAGGVQCHVAAGEGCAGWRCTKSWCACLHASTTIKIIEMTPRATTTGLALRGTNVGGDDLREDRRGDLTRMRGMIHHMITPLPFILQDKL